MHEPDRPPPAPPRLAGRLRAVLRGLPNWAVLLVLLLLSVPPLFMVVTLSFREGVLTANPTWTLANFARVLEALTLSGPILTSLVYSAGSALVALIIGGILAFITERTTASFRWLGYATAMMVVAVPAPVYAFGWALLFGRQGPVNTLLGDLFQALGLDFAALRLTNLPGMILVEGLHYSALAFFLLVGPMRSVDRSMEEAAVMSGARSSQVLMMVTGPLLRPAILAVLLLTFIRSMESFAVPAILGVPGNVTVITTEIYYAVAQRQPPAYGVAGAYGVVLVVSVVAMLFVYTSVTRQASRFATVTGKGFRARALDFGRARHALSAAVLVYALLLILPLSILALASIQRYYAGLSFNALTLDNYRELFGYREIAASFVNSFIVGVAAAAIIMAITLAAAWIAVRSPGREARLMDFAVSLPLALPGTVLGLALLGIFARLPPVFYGSLIALVIATIIRFIPYGFRFAHSGLIQIHRELEEAALMSGATRLQVMRRIVLPLIALPLAAGFIYVFLISARELEASALLVTSRTPVIATVLIDLYQNGYIPQLAAFSTVLVAVYGLAALIFFLFARRYAIAIR